MNHLLSAKLFGQLSSYQMTMYRKNAEKKFYLETFFFIVSKLLLPLLLFWVSFVGGASLFCQLVVLPPYRFVNQLAGTDNVVSQCASSSQ